MMDPLSYFLFQPELHNWCNKGRGMLSCLWDDAYNKFGKSSLCGSGRLPLSQSGCSPYV